MGRGEDTRYLADLWDELLSDPVDAFEDELAEELGITRPPEMPYQEWRRVRVAAIEAVDESDEEGV